MPRRCSPASRGALVTEHLPRRLAAILYADVAGYSRLTGEDEDATHRTLSEYLDYVSSSIESHNGQVMHYAGDAVLAKFDAVVDALSSAVAIQTELSSRNNGVPDERRVHFRIGVNLGDVIEDRGDIYGDGVNVAARLESLAEPGGICISESVRAALGTKLPLEFKCMGEQQVKNIAEPVVAYRAALQAKREAEQTSAQTTNKQSGKPSIVVLPFLNLSGDPEQEYFSDGVTEEIITGLSRFRELFVIARTSSFTLKGQSVDISETASKLGVQYVLEGSVRKAGNRVRVTAQLIDATTGGHLWAENYDRALEDVFAVQDDVAQTIVATLMGRLEEASRERALQKRTTSLSAYDYWLRGKHFFVDWKGTEEDFRQAKELFEKATELDPDFAPAYVGLAGIHLKEWEWGLSDTPEETAERAVEFARRAVELDDRDSNARLILASVYLKVRSNFELAEAQIEKAIELNPNDYWNYCFKSYFLTCSGNLEEGISCGHDAIRRNPFVPDGCLWNIGFAEYFAGQYDRALATFGKISSAIDEVDACVAACYAQLGRDEQAVTTASEIRDHGNQQLPKNTESWRVFWQSKFHFKDSAALDHLLDGLKKAGLSD